MQGKHELPASSYFCPRRALWTALRNLNEQHAVQQSLAQTTNDSKMKQRFNENAAAAEGDMEKLHDIISRL